MGVGREEWREQGASSGVPGGGGSVETETGWHQLEMPDHEGTDGNSQVRHQNIYPEMCSLASPHPDFL